MTAPTASPGQGGPVSLYFTWDFFWLATWVRLLTTLQAVGPSSIPGGTEADALATFQRRSLQPAGSGFISSLKAFFFTACPKLRVIVKAR